MVVGKTEKKSIMITNNISIFNNMSLLCFILIYINAGACQPQIMFIYIACCYKFILIFIGILLLANKTRCMHTFSNSLGVIFMCIMLNDHAMFFECCFLLKQYRAHLMYGVLVILWFFVGHATSCIKTEIYDLSIIFNF